MSAVLSFFATCPKGVNDLLSAELLSFGAEDLRESAAGVSFRGTMETAYRACLWSRLASRILHPLGTFPMTSEEDLYAGIRDIPWEEHFTPDQTFAVNASGKAGKLDHTHYASLKAKDAVADRFRDLTGGRPSVNVREPDIRLNLHMSKDAGTVSLDFSGEALHRRGYRHEKGKAPLKENLAAAILMRAGWPQIAAEGGPFVDPMCGSGTFLIEAALMAGDIAPGIFRAVFGFMGWRLHQSGVWTNLQVEARYRMKEGLERVPEIIGYDSDRAAVRAALGNLQRAGLSDRVHVERRELVSLTLPRPLRDRRGLVLVNPPYGERLGESEQLKVLYASLGERFKGEFKGWKGAVFTGDPELGKEMGIRAVKVNKLYNGTIPCRLLHFEIEERLFISRAVSETSGKVFNRDILQESEMFENRLRKNLRTTGKWAAAHGITCYRIYDADVPEFNMALDLYGDRIHVQEYKAPYGVDSGRAALRLEAALERIQQVFQFPADRIHVKIRERQKGGAQYGKEGDRGEFNVVEEGGLRFLVNLTDYIDTGLFLHHRRTRNMIRENASGRVFLNLFCYTGTATVYAADGGAASTTSVDLSNTYLDWARRNMDLNSIRGKEHRFHHADVVQWIRKNRGKYGLIFLDPPTYSRSKGMGSEFDVQRDHGQLILDTARLLAPGGVLLFAVNRRNFQLDRDSLADLNIEDITRETIPRDFERSRWVHKCYKIST